MKVTKINEMVNGIKSGYVCEVCQTEDKPIFHLEYPDVELNIILCPNCVTSLRAAIAEIEIDEEVECEVSVAEIESTIKSALSQYREDDLTLYFEEGEVFLMYATKNNSFVIGKVYKENLDIVEELKGLAFKYNIGVCEE